jgi:hypothetical protein
MYGSGVLGLARIYTDQWIQAVTVASNLQVYVAIHGHFRWLKSFCVWCHLLGPMRGKPWGAVEHLHHDKRDSTS